MFCIVIEAKESDCDAIRKFTDYWLSGRGLQVKAPGAVNDCFISPSQHLKYITKYRTWILKLDDSIIGWAVIQNDGSLIHLLIAGTHRSMGFGSMLLKQLKPLKVHSKNDQSSGDPERFYILNGYKKIRTIKSRSRLDIDKIKPNRKKNIDIFVPI